MEKVLLAGGCFWCVEAIFLDLPGVETVTSGYSGGELPNPTYEAVCQGNTGHIEAVQITFDPEKITFLQLLDTFWSHVDPLDPGGQFTDRGTQYQTAIFYYDALQQQLAQHSKNRLQALFSDPIATQILLAKPFYLAEAHHQRYCKTQPDHYLTYSSSHLPTLQKIWEDKLPLDHTDDDLNAYLTPLQFKVTQQEGTEPPFDNFYVDEKREGIYLDVISGVPLFSSEAKYDSKSGWPSFIAVIDPDELIILEDWSLGTLRTEVRGRKSNAHLGHVFPDGPPPSGVRYCMNSAALRFIPSS